VIVKVVVAVMVVCGPIRVTVLLPGLVTVTVDCNEVEVAVLVVVLVVVAKVIGVVVRVDVVVDTVVVTCELVYVTDVFELLFPMSRCQMYTPGGSFPACKLGQAT